MQHTEREQIRIPGLDGVRALAVIAVTVYHLWPQALPGGFVGVDVFFVLSGYLITRSFRRETAERTGARLERFWRHRARRILPPLLPVVGVTAIGAGLIGGDVLPGLWSAVVGAATFTSNWIAVAQASSYFAETTAHPLQHLWSLAVEEQFYLLWPLLLVLIGLAGARTRRYFPLGIATVSAIAMAVVFVPGTDPTTVYVGTGTHVFGLALGAALALDDERSDRSRALTTRCRVVAVVIGVASSAALVTAAFLLGDTSSFTYRGGLAAASVAAVALIWSVTRGAPGIGRLLDVPPLRIVGRRSFAIYLWHWPIFVLLTAATTPRTAGGHVVVGVTTVVLTVAASAVSWRWLEVPILRNGWRRTWHTAFSGSRTVRLVAAVTVGVLTLGTVATCFASTRPSEAEQLVAAGQRYLHDHSASPAPAGPRPADATAAPTTAVPASGAPSSALTPPAPDATRSRTTITAIGDSVMLAAAPTLQAVFPNISINAVVSRQPAAVAPILRSDAAAGTLADTVLVGTGTNGALGTALPAIRAAIGPTRTLVLVTAHGDRPWIAGVDATIRSYAQTDGRCFVADWDQAISSHEDLLASDGIHPGARGARIYAETILAALPQ